MSKIYVEFTERNSKRVSLIREGSLDNDPIIPHRGIHCKFVTTKGETIDFKAESEFFTRKVKANMMGNEAEIGCCTIALNGLVFELHPIFVNGKIFMAMLYEWRNINDYYGGVTEDMVYQCHVDKRFNIGNIPFICEEIETI